VLNNEKALQRWRAAKGFFFVDKRFELSNLDLVKGLMEVVESLVFLIP
jgi:hypothetical protein